MATKSLWEILKRPLGYEIAILLASGPKTRNELAENLPYSNVHQTQYERILEKGFENGIFDIKGTRGPDKYEIVEEAFSNEELRKLNERALLRILDPSEPQGEPPQLEEIPDAFFYSVRRDQIEKIENGFDFAVGEPGRTSEYRRFSSQSSNDGNETLEKTSDHQNTSSPRHVNVADVESMYKGIDERPWES